ncbi:MAG: hypothetical protein KME05_22300 [Gloeocapsa sp. UFS-A4-WI-NPMV-4B04]|nr:hypothetical protein [Gloeocapsa sp. UFS-A4-WI-NPMV-4B04]
MSQRLEAGEKFQSAMVAKRLRSMVVEHTAFGIAVSCNSPTDNTTIESVFP